MLNVNALKHCENLFKVCNEVKHVKNTIVKSH